MSVKTVIRDWKLKLRYGRLTTPFSHFTALADVTVLDPQNGHDTPKGPAWMAMKCWARNEDQVVDMAFDYAGYLGCELEPSAEVQIYQTDPVQAPEKAPFGYDFAFTPYVRETKQ